MRVDVRGAGDPTQVVLEAIERHNCIDAVVRMIITADPESDLLLDERAIQFALRDAGANHVAALTRNVDARRGCGSAPSPEGLTPVELLGVTCRRRVPPTASKCWSSAREIF